MNQPQNKNYILYQIYAEAVDTNCYIFGSKKTKEVAIVDPGSDSEKIRELLKKEQLTPLFIINTHGHIDHIGANCDFDLPIYIHKRDGNFLTNPLLSLAALYGNFKKLQKATRLLEDDDIIKIADVSLKVIHTPGHTPGSISLFYDDILLSGDTLFADGVGRTDLPYGNSKQISESIKNKLFCLDDSIVVFPGHGEKTTIAQEKRNNTWA